MNVNVSFNKKTKKKYTLRLIYSQIKKPNTFKKIRLTVKLLGTPEAVLACGIIYSNFEDLPVYSKDFGFS